MSRYYEHDPKWRAAALLPTGEKMNPCHPETAEYYDPQQVAYIVNVGGSLGFGVDKVSLRCLTSFGNLGKNWAIGTRHAIRHDQTCKMLAEAATVVGISFLGRDGGRVNLGMVPDRKLSHWVFK